jgi:hypothetical protein
MVMMPSFELISHKFNVFVFNLGFSVVISFTQLEVHKDKFPQHSTLFTLHIQMILVNDQLDALFSMYLFHASTCFEQQVLIIRRIKLCRYIIWCNTL